MKKITFKQIVDDPIFKTELEKKLYALRTARLIPPSKGLRLRRTPLDYFIEKGKDNVESFLKEYLAIVTKTSALSKAQRVFIIQICNPGALKVLNYYEKLEQEKEIKKQKKQ